MVKCIVFDLDNTIWNGTLDANDDVKLNENIIEYIKSAFRNGIVLAIASKNDYNQAHKKIVELGIDQYFYKFYISWDDKYKAIKDLANRLNISVEHILFIDDSDIELSEALYYIPTLQILNVKNITILNRYLNNTTVLTDEAINRNKIYKILEQRKKKEQQMSKKEFLKYCNIKISIYKANENDFYRINELLSRTNQMNLNNKILSVDELKKINQKEEYTIFSIKMTDIFADYGIVGTVIIKEKSDTIEIKYFAISCKVEGRNIGKKAIEHIKKIARKNKKNIEAKYIYNLKNEKLRALFVLNEFILDENNKYIYNLNKKNISAQNDKNIDEKIRTKVKEIIKDILKKEYKDEEFIREELDSLMFIRLIVTIEKEFGIEIDLSKINIQNFDTIEKICEFVEVSKNAN